MTLQQLPLDPGLLSGIFGVTTLIAAGLAGLTWGVVRTLRESNSDLRDRVDDLEKLREADKVERKASDDKHAAKVQGFEEKLDQLAQENATLAKLVTGEVHWVALTHLLEEHHAEASDHWQEIGLVLSNHGEILTRLAERAEAS